MVGPRIIRPHAEIPASIRDAVAVEQRQAELLLDPRFELEVERRPGTEITRSRPRSSFGRPALRRYSADADRSLDAVQDRNALSAIALTSAAGSY